MTALPTSKQRAERAYRARRLAAGDKLLRVWMTPETADNLRHLQQRYEYTQEQVIAAVIACVTDGSPI